MSHRAEEKERRRQERMAAEQAAQQSADRRKRLGLVGGVALVAAVVVFVVFVAIGGGDENGGGGGGGSEEVADVEVPAQQIENLNEAARAGQCTVSTHKVEGRGHTGEKVEYKTNPPTSGSHDPGSSEDGVYEPGNPPDVEQSVHSLEHGRVLIQYKKGTPQEQIDQLETVANEEVKGTPLYHTLVFENQTSMEPAVAATAWGRSLTCDTFNDKIFDAIRAFRRDRVDKGPEFIP